MHKVSPGEYPQLGKWYFEDLMLQREPFEHVIIDNFLDDTIAIQIRDEFPTSFPHIYNNPIEKKYAKDTDLPPIIQETLNSLCNEKFIRKVGLLFGCDLEFDPFLHGGGCHCYPKGGYLLSHLDYHTHPISGKTRQVNLILYLNESEDGPLELWNRDEIVVKVPPLFNRAILFRTTGQSWHGITTPLKTERKSVAIYYVNNEIPTEDRPKAQFRTTSQHPFHEDPRMQQLLKIRCQRRIEESDLAIWPTWKQDIYHKYN